MRIGFFLREALRSMSRNAIPSFAAMASVLVTVLVLGVFIPIVQAATGAANDVRSRVLVDVYLKTRRPGRRRRRASETCSPRAATPHVGKVQYVSKRDALAEQRRKYPEAYDLLGSNPLPDTFRDHAATPRRRAEAPRRAGAVDARRRAHDDRPRGRRRQEPRATRRRRSSSPRAW